MLKTRVEQKQDKRTPIIGASIMVLSVLCFMVFLEAVIALVRFAIG